ncbi:MAG: hypothetical protein ABI647_23275, partial [Gemmatimonadota bacterium]
ASVAIFLWAAWTNSRIALTRPADYQTFGELTVLGVYPGFLHGWFRDQTVLLLLPIAAGELIIAVLLLSSGRAARRLAVLGAVVFLLAIAPLGVGSAFPFSLTYGLALVIMAQRSNAGRPAGPDRGGAPALR